MLMVGCTTNNRPVQSSQNQHHHQIMAYPDDVGFEPED